MPAEGGFFPLCVDKGGGQIEALGRWRLDRYPFNGILPGMKFPGKVEKGVPARYGLDTVLGVSGSFKV